MDVLVLGGYLLRKSTAAKPVAAISGAAALP
jgi:hypothetical protein